MASEVLLLIIFSLLAIPLVWIVQKNTWDALALWAFLCLLLVSPISAIWLVCSSLFISLIMYLGDRWGGKNYLTLLSAGLLSAILLIFRESPQLLLIGGAYFTLRSLHVLFDWWMGKLVNPGVIRNLRYQLFLPTLMAGPINRFQVFERQIDRRRWDSSEFFSGAERVLFGIAQVIVLGGWLITQLDIKVLSAIFQNKSFFSDWSQSVLEWIELYFVFAGYSSIALGLALMMGLRLEENFNRPWAAKNLVDFWMRWHITLSQWVRDYVFQPITALTRIPIIGLMAAMLVIGLWHETSTYYVLWAAWQVLGIVLTKLIQSMVEKRLTIKKVISKFDFLAPFLVLGWLSLAYPVITYILGLFS